MFRISAHFLSYQMATRLWPVGRNQLWIAICRHLMIMLDSTFVLRHFQHTPLWRTVKQEIIFWHLFMSSSSLVLSYQGRDLLHRLPISLWSPQDLCWDCQSEPYLVDINASPLLIGLCGSLFLSSKTDHFSLLFILVWSPSQWFFNSLLIFPPLSCYIFVLHLLADLVFSLILYFVRLDSFTLLVRQFPTIVTLSWFSLGTN